MTALAQFKESNAWSKEFNLPLCPGLNNPFIYMSYASLVIQESDGVGLPVGDVITHYLKCEQSYGVFNRWPDGSGGLASHDEIMGAAYFSGYLANRFYSYLEDHNGKYGDQNLYRFIFLKPYLKSCITNSISVLQKILWCLSLIADSFNYDQAHNAGGKLRNYLMIKHMRKFWMCRQVAKFWRMQMLKHGITFKSCLAIEPKEFPIFSQLAHDDWII